MKKIKISDKLYVSYERGREIIIEIEDLTYGETAGVTKIELPKLIEALQKIQEVFGKKK